MKSRIVSRGIVVAACSVVAYLVAGCGGSTNETTAPHLVANIAVPNSTSPAFSFDISYADQHGKYFLADRNNKAVDVVDTGTNTLIAQIPGSFTGISTNTSVSGPNGLVGVPGTNDIYVGDVNAVKVIDTSTHALVKTIPVGTSGLRADEGCFDPDDHVILMASPADSPPFATFINTDTQAVVGRLTFNDSSGLEACEYDSGSKHFLINNDGTTANPDGEVDVIPASSVVAGQPAVTGAFPLGACGPTGMALGPNQDVMIGCDSAPGKPLISLILNRTTGQVLSTLPFGGVDQIAYDPVSNRYFLPARHWTASGVAASSGFTPTMAIVDASARSIVTKLAVGTGAHSVAIDGPSGHVYVPYQPGSAAFPNAGISVFTAR
jgi:hypothetical protein